jgi:hypothetical protein
MTGSGRSPAAGGDLNPLFLRAKNSLSKLAITTG